MPYSCLFGLTEITTLPVAGAILYQREVFEFDAVTPPLFMFVPAEPFHVIPVIAIVVPLSCEAITTPNVSLPVTVVAIVSDACEPADEPEAAASNAMANRYGCDDGICGMPASASCGT